ncbi:hypothetical protein LSAT2_029196 [Lamellibrachia satsuma]|nr:hypothetical protein LSAT2_029196 [Lamellibrachia satsuma]
MSLEHRLITGSGRCKSSNVLMLELKKFSCPQPNTFQLVFMSDTIQRKTYALYLYESVGWDRTLHIRPSTVGYYVTRYRRIRTKTLWMSNTTSAFRIGELVGNTGEVGKYFFPLTYLSTSAARTKCLQWHQAEKLKLSDIELRLKETLSCPCDLPQISADGRWTFDWKSFVSGHKSLCYNERQPGAQSSQYCCYDRMGALITAKDGSGGRLFLYHPRNTTEHRVDDVLPKKWCCDQSKNCGKFYEVRPMSNCLETRPPPVANVNGGWNDWSDWSTCSMTSGGLTKTRSRRCNNPAPEGDGLACLGVSVESEACDIIDCPTNVNSSCGDWSDWSVCSTTCGGGTKTRSRSCDTPIPEGEGLTCLGLSVESETCNINDCPGTFNVI